MGTVVPMSKVDDNWIWLGVYIPVDNSIQVWRPVVQST